MRRQIGTDIDGPDRLVEAGEELRRFPGPVCDSLVEESPFHAGVARRRAVAAGGSGSDGRRRW